jgi:hypothetical protein
MAIPAVLKRLSSAASLVRLILTQPRQFVESPEGFTSSNVSATELFGWMIGFGSVLLGLYSFALGSPMEKVLEASHLLAAPKIGASASHRDERVTLAGFRWVAGLGFGIDFPERRPFTEPQRANFQCGALLVRLNHVIPQNVMEKNTAKFLLALYAAVFVLCIHPVARLFGGKGNLRDGFRLGFILCAFLYLVMIAFLVIATLLLVDLLRLRGWPLLIAWALIAGLPGCFITLRCFFLSFSAFYQITKTRLFLVCLGTWISSSAISPVVFVPLIFVILRLEPLWKAIL